MSHTILEVKFEIILEIKDKYFSINYQVSEGLREDPSYNTR